MTQNHHPDKIILFTEPMPGVVEETITSTHPGRVRYQGTSWPSRLYNPHSADI